MFNYLKFFFQKFQSAKYIRKGKCNRCGACCRNILLFAADGIPVVTEEQFEKIKEWDKHFKSFYISGKSETGALLLLVVKLTKIIDVEFTFFVAWVVDSTLKRILNFLSMVENH